MNLFKDRIKSTNPHVVVLNYDKRGLPQFHTDGKQGVFYRVIPTSTKEINALRILEHRFDKFAPATGDGVLITANAMKMLDA